MQGVLVNTVVPTPFFIVPGQIMWPYIGNLAFALEKALFFALW